MSRLGLISSGVFTNLLKQSGYFIYYEIYHSKIFLSTHREHFLTVLTTSMIISLYNNNF